MARADERQSQASCFGDKGSQALGKESSGVGLGYLLLNIATLLLQMTLYLHEPRPTWCTNLQYVEECKNISG